MPEDRGADPGDTMPAQGWLPEGPHSWMACTLPTFAAHVAHCTDAGRFPAPREDTHMKDQMTTLVAESDREPWDHASERGATVAQFATAAMPDAIRELEGRSVAQLQELAAACRSTRAWGQQVTADAERVQGIIGQVLRSAADDIDPQQAAYATVERNRG